MNDAIFIIVSGPIMIGTNILYDLVAVIISIVAVVFEKGVLTFKLLKPRTAQQKGTSYDLCYE